MSTPRLFAVFPYLKTHSRARVRGIEFRSVKDAEGLPADTAQRFETFREMFRYADGSRIADMTVAALPANLNDLAGATQLARLQQAHLLISYMYNGPQQGGELVFGSEFASLYLLQTHGVSLLLANEFVGDEAQPEDGSPVARTERLRPKDGYVVLRDWVRVGQALPGTRLFPPVPSLRQNHAQSLAADLCEWLSHPANWGIGGLVTAEEDFLGAEFERFFVALQWYGRGCRRLNDAPESILHLAIALESLFQIPRAEEGLTERLKLAVVAMLGPVPRLDAWFDQFYEARSKIVHLGAHRELHFLPERVGKKKAQGEGERRHRPLLEYGLRVFRLCFRTALAGAIDARGQGLAPLLVHNEERLRDICAVLSKPGDLPDRRIAAVAKAVRELEEFSTDELWPTVPPAALVGTGKLLVSTYRAALAPEKVPFDARLEAIEKSSSDLSLALLEAFRELEGALQSGINDRSLYGEAHEVLLSFASYAVQPAFSVAALFNDQEGAPVSARTEPGTEGRRCLLI